MGAIKSVSVKRCVHKEKIVSQDAVRVDAGETPRVRGQVQVALLIALWALAPLSHAEQWCKGKVTSVLTEPNGNVQAFTTFRADWLQVCNLTAVWKGVPVDVCKSWLATLTTLRVTQEPALLFYVENTACSAIPSYASAPAPGYIAIDMP